MSIQTIAATTILINQKYIFIHSSKNDSSFCFNCYKERTKELKCYQQYFGWLEDQPNQLESELIAMLVQKLEKSIEPFLYELNRDTLEIQAKATFKRGDCECNVDTSSNRLMELDTIFDAKDNRQLSFEKVREKIEKNKKLIYAHPSSIVNALTRSGDSYGTPMVQTEVLYKGISMLSYGRTGTYEKSKYISILESLERYATAFPYKIQKTAIREKDSEIIDLTLSEVMTQCDYGNPENYTEDQPLNYEKVWALHSEKEVLIPEQLIYYNSHVVSDEKRYIYESSNGSALGSTEAEASLHAMLELIERDAFLATWYGQIPPVRIDESSIYSTKIQAYLESLKRKDIRVHLFDISMEVRIPTIWVLLEKKEPEENEMAFYTAAAASFDLEESIERALIEATTAITVFTNVFNNQEYQTRKRQLLKNPQSVHRLEDHLLLYSNKEMKSAFKFALDTEMVSSFEQLEAGYTTYQGKFLEVVRALEEQLVKISGKAYRATTENPNLFSAGFVNVKYIVPGMLTMTFGHQNRRVVSQRIEKAIQFKKKGKLDKNWIEKTPHPFP
ncbi:YcaO-like family protein [Viridibacillus sp. NPDC096237]|uniref:YcaO-like family protein n=1 Tax=Viridibacillus sp. NPDC096237 TaxID=3390721 RepID=UPI003CFF889B